MINCNEINQTVNELLIAFANCKHIKNSDLIKLVELVAAVNSCANGGPAYDTEETDLYEPETDLIVTYPINSFHSYSIVVLEGKMTQQVGMATVTYNTGTTIDLEFTNLNQTAVVFTAKAQSKILIKYITQTN